MLSKQEIFDKVATHLMTQGVKAQGCRTYDHDDYGCLYRVKRSGKTLTCAVGCLIKAKHYRKSLEGNSCNSLLLEEPLRKSGIDPVEYCDFLLDLQEIHDGTAVEYWGAELVRLAKKHALSCDALLSFMSKEQIDAIPYEVD